LRSGERPETRPRLPKPPETGELFVGREAQKSSLQKPPGPSKLAGMSPSSATLPSGPARRLGLAVLLVMLGLVVYLPSLRNGFVWDDDTFLTKNPLIQAPDGLARFWFTTQPTDYWPVTSTTLWLEWRLWGTHAAGYHAMNLVLHLGEALLLWSILRRLRVPGAYLAALLFVVHPVNVESVAWIAQRKNLVAMLFYLLAVFCFLRTRLVTRDGPRPALWYALSLLAFLLAMLSKGSVAPLPVVLLGIVAWQRRPNGKDLAALTPFFIVSAGLIAVNIWFQTHGNHEIIRQANGAERLLGAAAAVWFYLYKAIAPVGLIFVYPQWHIDTGLVWWWLPFLGAVGMTAGLWRVRREVPALFFAWAYFVVMLLPVLGFTDVFFMRYSLVADHYQHLALIGVLALAAAGWDGWRRQPRGAAPAWVTAALVVGVFGILTWRQTRFYRSEETLYRATLERSPGSWMVYNNLGLLESAAGRKAAAAQDFATALRVNPAFAEAYVNRGELQLESGSFAAAIGDFQEALRLRPSYPEASYNLGIALHGLGRNTEAVAAFETALRLRPYYPAAENNLGAALVDLGQVPEAIHHFERAIQLDPAYAEVHFNLANTLAGQHRDEEALGQYGTALRLKPNYPEAENNLALADQRAQRLDEAIAHFQAAVRLRPDYLQARNNLGVALAMAQRLDEAQAQFQEVLRQQPNYAPARQNLNRLRAMGR
jgi:protein O-mannosyl-transferase